MIISIPKESNDFKLDFFSVWYVHGLFFAYLSAAS